MRLAFYLKKLLIPLSLCLDYGRSPAAAMKMALKFAWMVRARICALEISRPRAAAPGSGDDLFNLVLPVLGLTPFMYQAHFDGGGSLYVSADAGRGDGVGVGGAAAGRDFGRVRG